MHFVVSMLTLFYSVILTFKAVTFFLVFILSLFPFQAVEGHHLEAARCLLEQRANPDVPDQNLDTALHLALSTGQADMAALLVQFDADVSARNKVETSV